MKTKLLILLAAIVVFSQAKAQIFYGKTYDKYGVKNRTIIFSLPKSDTKDGKENLMTESDFKALIEKYWIYSNKYEMLPYKESMKKAKENKNKTLVAQFVVRCNVDSKGLRVSGDMVNEFRLVVPGTFTNYMVRVFLDDEITESDIVYALVLTQFMLKGHTKFTKPYVWKESPKIYGTKLKSKTLLIDNNDLMKISEKEIKNIYPYKFRVVDKSVIDTTIINKNPDFLIIYAGKLLFEDGTSKPINIVFQPQKGAIVSWSSSKVSFGEIGLRKEFTDKTFKQFVKNAGL